MPATAATPGAGLRRFDLAVLAALLPVAAALAWALMATPVDDAYIYLRVAANIAEGHGWSYNPGEPANPATSTSFVLLLAALGRVAGFGTHTLAASFALCLFALLAAHYLAWRRSDGVAIALLACAVIASSSRLLASVGMETALLLAAVSWTALAWQRRGDGWVVGLLAGITALTRPEGLLVLALIGLCALLQRRLAWRSLLAALVVVLPWVVWATLEFGSPLAQTAAVKAAQRHYGWWGQQPDFLIAFLQQPAWPWLTLPAAAIGIVLAARRWRGGDAFAAICIGFGLLQVIGYQFLGAPLGYPWYHAPGNLAVDLALVLVIAAAAAWARRHFTGMAQGARRSRATAVATACTLACAPLFLRAGMTPAAWPTPPAFAADYRNSAEWLRAHAAPGDEAAATEIGRIGWHSGLRILDIHGLIHPQALPALREGNLHWWYDAGLRPRFVVSHVPAWHGEPGSAETWPESLSADFFAGYRLVHEHGVMRIHERVAPPR